MKSLFRCAGIALATFSLGANAQSGNSSKPMDSTFSYDFISVGFDMGKLDVGSGSKETSKTGTFQFSKSLTDTFFVVGRFGSLDIDTTTGTSYDVGVGARVPMSQATDVSAAAMYSSFDVSGGGSTSNPTGYAFSVSLRHALAEKVEVEGSYYYASLSETGSDSTNSTIGVEARYKLASGISVGLVYKNYLSDIEGYDLGVNARLEF